MELSFTARKAYQRLFWKIIPRSLAPFADPSSEPHPCVEVNGLKLDVGIAALVQACWRAGMPTGGSCQGDADLYDLFASRHPAQGRLAANEHSAHICFETVADGLKAKGWVEQALPPPTKGHLAVAELVVGAGNLAFLHVHPSDLPTLISSL